MSDENDPPEYEDKNDMLQKFMSQYIDKMAAVSSNSSSMIDANIEIENIKEKKYSVSGIASSLIHSGVDPKKAVSIAFEVYEEIEARIQEDMTLVRKKIQQENDQKISNIIGSKK